MLRATVVLAGALTLGACARAPRRPGAHRMYLPARTVTSLAVPPSCVESKLDGERLVELVVRERGKQVSLTPSETEGIDWLAKRSSSVQACSPQSAADLQRLRQRCGRIWPLRRPPSEARVVEDAKGRTHALFVTPRRDGAHEIHYARCGEESEHQVLGVAAAVDAVTLSVDARADPHAIYVTRERTEPGEPLSFELVYAHDPHGLSPPHHAFDPALQLGLRACVARYEREPCRLGGDSGSCRTAAAEDEVYCDWLVAHLDDDELQTRRFLRNQTPTSCHEDATRSLCIAGQGLIFDYGVMRDVRWSFVLGRGAPRYEFETLFGQDERVLAKEPGCFPGLDAACFQTSMVRLSEKGSEATMHKLYQRSDGSVVPPIRDDWKTTRSTCERGEDERACTAVAIGWERGTRNGHRDERWTATVLNVLDAGCAAGDGLACLQTWWVRRQSAAAPPEALPSDWDVWLRRGCARDVADACATLADLDTARQRAETRAR